MVKGTKAIGLLMVSAALCFGWSEPVLASGTTSVPSAGVGQILEADLAEEDYLAAAEKRRMSGKQFTASAILASPTYPII